MNAGIHYMTIQDLMELAGLTNYKYAARKHKAMRDAILKGKESLSIREYCAHTGEDYDFVFSVLRPFYKG